MRFRLLVGVVLVLCTLLLGGCSWLQDELFFYAPPTELHLGPLGR